jgi:biotin carboxyl carrier protein
MEIVVNRTKRIKLTAALRNTDDGMIQVRMWPENLKDDYHWELDVENPMVSAHGDASALSSARRKSGEHAVPSPMPGKISRVHYAVGDQVEEGDVVVVLEAMKMEHACKSPCSGTVTELPYSPDDVVNDGAILFIVTSPETDEPTADGDE